MKSRAITHPVFACVLTISVLAASLAGLAVGRARGAPGLPPRTQTNYGASDGSVPAAEASLHSLPATITDGSCDAVCVDEGCVSIPADQLPPIQITDTFIIYPTSACLCENQDGTKRLEGEGEVFLPNIQTEDGTEGIHVRFILAWPSLDPQCVQFTGEWEEGVPIGESGFLLTSMEGEMVFEPEPTVQVSGTIESELQAPDGSGPAVTGEGTLWIALEEPYDVTFEGTLYAFNNRTVEATMTLDQSWGLAGSATLTGPVCEGPAFLHVWPEGEGAYGASGSASLTCTIPAGSLTPDGWPEGWPGIPQQDITAAADGELGEFCLECAGDQCAQETYGVWAGTSLELSLPENLVESGPVTTRFFISSTGILSATTNLEQCEQTGQEAPHTNQPGPTARYCLNDPPTIAITSPSTAEEQPDGSGSYTIRWTANDPDSDAVVSLYYDRDGSGRDGRLIACCLGEGESSYAWDTSEVGSGTYYIYGRIDDGKNLPVVAYSAGTVKVVDHTAPASPGRPSATLTSNTVNLSWPASSEEDVVGYRVYYGPKPGIYLGSYDATNMTRFRLPLAGRRPRLPHRASAAEVTSSGVLGVPPARTAYMAISAYDSSGNESPPSEAVRLWFVYVPALLR
ncbi:MAG: hypothetical protein ACE5F6_01855 [Anaerolineae bacterium]